MGPQGELGLPSLVKDTIKILSTPDALEMEGLFRISPVMSAARKIRLGYDSGNHTKTFKALECDPGRIHIAASLLKAFVRELPEPLLTDDIFSQLDGLSGEIKLPYFLETTNLCLGLSQKDRIAYIRSRIVSRLSPSNLVLFNAIMSLLSKVSNKSSVNRMTTQNLAIVWSPNFLPKTLDPMADLTGLIVVLQVCIDRYSDVFAH